MKKILSKTIGVMTLMLVFSGINAFAQVASGGTFTLTQSVVGGGGDSSGGNFSVTGTSGQSAAGTQSNGGNFSVRGGFWSSSATPTAAVSSIGGRVLSADGRGINRVRVTVTDETGVSFTALTNAFGYYRFEELLSGHTYVFTVNSRNYQFVESTQIFFVSANRDDVNFFAVNQP